MGKWFPMGYCNILADMVQQPELLKRPSLQPKNLLIINILDIFRKYTNEEHLLSQQDIKKILKRIRYGTRDIPW